MARRSGGALGWGTVLGIIIMILPIIVIALESRSQQNVCKERLQYLLIRRKDNNDAIRSL